jgi:predicted dehydrogenase
VIGCGVLGTRHAEIYARLPSVELVGVFDIHPEKTQTVAALCNTRPFNDLESLARQVDAASVCTPARAHYGVARTLMDKGVHLLIEKPITTRLEEADELLRLAHEKRLILQTGHVERFNAAIRHIKTLVKNPRFIECDRIGTYDARVQDVGVILDLMIHDIDILLYLVGSEVELLDTIAMSMLSPTEDFANCRIRFKNGTVASLTASRIARAPLRKIRIFQENAYISIDYVRQEAAILTQDSQGTAYRTIDILKSQPLQEELGTFVSCVRNGEQPLVSGVEGRAALAVALRALEQVSAASRR